jgi:hypothetical protein
MCDRSPVSEVLSKSSLREIQSAFDTATARADKARAEGDKVTADLFKRVAGEIEAELERQLLQIATRSVLDESRAALREARNLLGAALNG